DPAKAFQIDPATGNRIANTGDPFNGIIQGGKNSRFGDAVSVQRNLDFAPRFGFAWDPFSNGKTSVRGGYGIFYDTTTVGTLQQNIGANPTASFSSIAISNTRLDNPAAGAPVVSLAPASLRGTPVDYRDPYMQQWGLEIQRQLPGDLLVSAGYVGSKGTHLIGVVDLNQVPPGLDAAARLVPPAAHLTSPTPPRPSLVPPY